VKVDAVAGEWQTFVDQHGASRAAFYLQVTPAGGWQFSLSEEDRAGVGWAGAQTADGVVEPGVWTHVAGVFDLASGEARMYINGELVATGAGPASPWQANGPLYIGAGGIDSGRHINRSAGRWTRWLCGLPLDPDRIASLGRPVLGEAAVNRGRLITRSCQSHV
jgi:hypothetical protein